VEWAVVEVGLGGRLDTTNVLIPEVAAITSVGRDHTEILGDSVERIAAEKAGIAKHDVPLVMGAGMDRSAAGVIRDTATRMGAPLVEVSDADLERDSDFDAWLAGFDSPWGALAPAPRTAAGFGHANTATALAVLARLHRTAVPIPRAALLEGLAAARWPGRFERCPTRARLLWDGAHNPHGAAALERSWRRAGLASPAALVLALSRDKDVDGMLAPLARLAGPGAALFATRTRNERALDPALIAEAAAGVGLDPRLASSVPEACEAALAQRDPADRPVLLTGSLFAVGEAMAAFGGAPGEWL
jgi:dihydrofolate synthase/folylpolyglutamate synthase